MQSQQLLGARWRQFKEMKWQSGGGGYRGLWVILKGADVQDTSEG